MEVHSLLMACLIFPPCIVSQVTCSSWILIPAPVFLWLLHHSSVLKSSHASSKQLSKHTFHGPKDMSFEKEFTINNFFHGPLSRAPGYKCWAEVGLHPPTFFFAFPSINLCLFRNDKSNTQDCTYPFQGNHKPGGVFTQCPQSKDTFSSKTKLQSIKLSKHNWCHHFPLLVGWLVQYPPKGRSAVFIKVNLKS